MNCAECGTHNEPDRKFCIECGAALVALCPVCGSSNPPQAKFCGECGSPLREGATPTPLQALESARQLTERRLVSVLFADLVSFTSLSEQRDAEDMRLLMDAYFVATRTVIERHGGVVEKFIGDAVMAVWGTPVTHEDDAERAVRAALELVDAVAGLGESTGVALQVRVGVLTGEAATAPDAGNQAMVTGDMVNTAARLQSAAPPGGVLVGAATHRAASGAIAFDEVGELHLKGKEEPVQAWRALRVVAQRQGQNRMTIEPPFVGRTEELRLMKELLHATGREGRSRVVSVMGIGGIGKSRLAWELKKYVDGLSEDTYWHHGRCPSYGDGVTFWALGEMVRMRTGIAETDAPGVSRKKLAESIADYVPDGDERRWIEPRLAFLLGLDDRPAGGREELFAAWRTFFERISDHGTVAMVFEDLQWADAGLLDFIESMLEWSRSKPIYIVTLARPDIADLHASWGSGQHSFLALHLEPLPEPTMAELVRGLVPDADGGAVERIVDRAEGVPLYAVEMIRMLADRGILRAAGGTYELVGDLGDIQVPETLHALIASRLDALGRQDRILAQHAAVLGMSFTFAALVAVTGADPNLLEARLHVLTRKEFVEFEADPRSPERGQYGFVQCLIQEVAYAMLSKADRRDRHLAAARHFEAAHDDELTAVVAAHYVAALQSTQPGPDAEALGVEARAWLTRSAARAAALGSPIQALGYAEQALAFTPTGRERADLLRHAAETAEDALRREERIEYLREAERVLHGLGDTNAEVACMGELANALGAYYQVDEMRQVLARMPQLLDDDVDHLARAAKDEASSLLQYFDGDLQASLGSLERAVAGYDRARAWPKFGAALGHKINLLAFAGRHREAWLLLRGRHAVATEENDLRETAGALMSLALWCDEATESLEYGLQAASVAHRGGYGELEAMSLSNGLETAVETGAWGTADGIITDLRQRADLPDIVIDSLQLGAVLLAAYRGEVTVAREALATVRHETADSADHSVRSWYRRVTAVLHLMAGALEPAFDEAIGAITTDPGGVNTAYATMSAGHAAIWLRDPERARQLLAAVPDADSRWARAIRQSIAAGVLALDGHPRDAASSYDSVLAGRLAAGDHFAHALMAIDAVTVLPADLVPQGAADAARAYLEELGASPLLDRLEQARADPPSG